MPLSLGLYTTVAMILISSPFCSMCGAAVARGIKRQHPHHHQRLEAVYYCCAFLSSSRKFVGPTPTPPPRRQQRQLQQGAMPHRHCCDITTTSLKSWRNPATGAAEGVAGATMQLRLRRNAQLGAAVRAAVEQPRLQAGGLMTRKKLFSSGSLSSASRPHPSSPKATPIAPCNVAVLARGDSGDDLERCRCLAQKLGVELVVPRREGKTKQGKKHEQENRGGGAVVGGAAEGENGDFKFTMLFDERGRLALDQPGSGFNPLVVDFLGGKTGHRSKHQQGKTEQVVKAAALPKRRAAPSASAAAAATNEICQPSPSRQSPASSPPLTSGTDSDENDEVAAPLPLLWDLTAGLGTDSFLLAQAGWRVEMFERSPVVAALVQDALDRARAGDDETARTAASRMSLTVAESTHFLATFGLPLPATKSVAAVGGEEGASSAPQPDVVYLDPMFPQPENSRRRKSALVKKGMQMLQALLEETDVEEARREGQEGLAGTAHSDGGDVSDRKEVGGMEGVGGEERRLFDVAMSLAARKVVVKRPVHGAAIVQHVKPSHAVLSKNGRFDVYVVPP